ncbi:hypothetical protein HK405_002886 [Cladochytrium tenue]|nr:hypothetical protein HK405_002886 [Cladochytrium tenue]
MPPPPATPPPATPPPVTPSPRPQPATALPDIIFGTIVRDLPVCDLRTVAATSRAYRALVARVAVPRLLFLLSHLLFETVRLGSATIAVAVAADIRSGRPAAAPRAASQLAGLAAFVAELIAAVARSLPAAASGTEAAAAAAVREAMCTVWSHADAHWFFTETDEEVVWDEEDLWRMARRRREALVAIERAAAVVVRGEDGGDSDGDDVRRSVARGLLTGLSSSERLSLWRAAAASSAENAEGPSGIRQRQRIDRATFITARLGPPDIEAALADIIAGLPAEPCRCSGTTALFFWIDEDGNLIAQENVDDRDRLLSVSQKVFEITRTRVDKLEADGCAPEEAFSQMIEETLVHNGSIGTMFSIMDCCLELLPTPATTLSAADVSLRPRLARALALALFRAIKEQSTTVDLWRCIQQARKLLTAQPGLRAFPLAAARAVQAIEAKLSECLRILLVAPHVQALDDDYMSQELEVVLAGARRSWEQFLTVAFCEAWEVDRNRAPENQLLEECFLDLRRVAIHMYDTLEAATQLS